MSVELIKRRRAQMLIHSYLYYWLNDNIIDDSVYDKWAVELAELQKSFDGEVGFYDEAFKDWDGSTGMHLPVDAWVAGQAVYLSRIHDRKQVQ